MKSITPMRMRVRHFLTDRYAYSSDRTDAVELVAFGLIILTATASWPSLLTATAMTGLPK